MQICHQYLQHLHWNTLDYLAFKMELYTCLFTLRHHYESQRIKKKKNLHNTSQ